MINRTLKWIALSLIFGIMVFLTACSGNTSPNSAPDFSLKNLKGDTVSLKSYDGKSVLLNFWATSCPTCVIEMPVFQELSQDWAKRDEVVFLAVNVGENLSTVRDYIKLYGYTFPVLLDSGFEVFEKFHLRYTPTTILIGKDREIKYKVVGAFKNKEGILKAIEPYLK
jgi:peroxiredoxin